jgi:hypothetical protein
MGTRVLLSTSVLNYAFFYEWAIYANFVSDGLIHKKFRSFTAFQILCRAKKLVLISSSHPEITGFALNAERVPIWIHNVSLD